MVTELQFLIDLLLNHKLPKATKDLVAKRIGEVETGLIPPPRHIALHPSVRAMGNQVEAQAMQAAPPPPVSARIVGGEVSTGNGTKGPRKF